MAAGYTSRVRRLISRGGVLFIFRIRRELILFFSSDKCVRGDDDDDDDDELLSVDIYRQTYIKVAKIDDLISCPFALRLKSKAKADQRCPILPYNNTSNTDNPSHVCIRIAP